MCMQTVAVHTYNTEHQGTHVRKRCSIGIHAGNVPEQTVKCTHTKHSLVIYRVGASRLAM